MKSPDTGGRGQYEYDYLLKEAQFILVVRNQHILGLAIVIQHHFMRFTAKA